MEKTGQRIRDYLLGNLPDAEIESLDLAVMADPGFENLLLQGESGLNEDFLDGHLTEDEVNLFFKNYLVTPERKDDLNQIRLLQEHAVRPIGRLTDDAVEDGNPDFFRRLKKMFEMLLRPVPALTLLFVLTLSGVVLWQIFSDAAGGISEKQIEFVKLNKTDLSQTAELQGKPSLSLLPGVLRDANGQRKVTAAEFGGEVILRLAIPSGMKTGQKYRAEIRNSAEGLLTLEDVSVDQNATGSEIRLILPSGYVVPGNYRIELSASEKDGELPLVYSFLAE